MLKFDTRLALVLAMATGCAGLTEALKVKKPRDGSKEYQDAKSRKDIEALKRLCADEDLGDPNSSSVPANAGITEQGRIQSNRGARRDACREAEALAGDKDDGNCATVAERFKNSKMSDGELHDAFYGKWAERLGKCDKFDVVFENIVHVGDMGDDAIGAKVLASLEAAQLPVEAGFVKYAQTHAGAAFLPGDHGHFASDHLRGWLIRGKHFSHCDELSKALDGARDGVRANVLMYFTEAKCAKQGRAIGVSLLLSDKPLNRIIACANLANTGDAAAAKKLNILAETDAYFEVVTNPNGVAYKQWPVRDACKAAAGKITLRGE